MMKKGRRASEFGFCFEWVSSCDVSAMKKFRSAFCQRQFELKLSLVGKLSMMRVFFHEEEKLMELEMPDELYQPMNEDYPVRYIHTTASNSGGRSWTSNRPLTHIMALDYSYHDVHYAQHTTFRN